MAQGRAEGTGTPDFPQFEPQCRRAANISLLEGHIVME
jgi:hypothetical protein